ncbi:MAG: hypothetical protein HYV68_02680 [Candidatus Taylorbacteria bacterium]|nr:hypothetical protein [Candidatus Taylorbacteria bacterium]
MENQIGNWNDALRLAFFDLWSSVANFVPRLLVAIVIFLAGWLIGVLLDKVVAQVVRSIKIDNALRRLKFDELLRRGGFNLDSGLFLGALVKWFIIVAFLIAALDVLRLTAVTLFLQDIAVYLPQVIVAVLILMAAALIAEVVQRIVVGAAQGAGLTNASFVGLIAKWAIWIFAIMAALVQLQIMAAFIQTLFTGIVVAIALALGLSFGLGGQDAAAKAIDKVTSEIANRRHHQG